MKITKKINTSAALALDSSGKEIIVFGKGIGFPSVPYELEDLSKIQRTFYEVEPAYYGLIATLPEKLLLACSEIVEQAEEELECELNSNLPFTLADHVNFAINRIHNGINLTSPISYDIRHLYPKETKMGELALSILEENCGVSLPKDEVINIALHFINAEVESSSIHGLMESLNTIEDIETIVEDVLEIRLNKESYNYSRFVTHIRYLMQRLSSGQQKDGEGKLMLRTLAREYPDVYTCALKIADYLNKEKHWICNDEEILYLMLHINRVHENTAKQVL